VEVSKTLIIHAIKGRGVPIKIAEDMVKLRLAYFIGNQWNEDWTWHTEKLESMTLVAYQAIRSSRCVKIKQFLSFW